MVENFSLILLGCDVTMINIRTYQYIKCSNVTRFPYVAIPCQLEIAVSHWPFSNQFSPFGRANPILLGQIYCTFPMEKPLIVYSNVPAFKEWSTNFKLFQVLHVIMVTCIYSSLYMYFLVTLFW